MNARVDLIWMGNLISAEVRYVLNNSDLGKGRFVKLYNVALLGSTTTSLVSLERYHSVCA